MKEKCPYCKRELELMVALDWKLRRPSVYKKRRKETITKRLFGGM